MKVCSFCGKKRDEVAHMVTGGAVAICNECVSLCVDIIRAEAAMLERPDTDPFIVRWTSLVVDSLELEWAAYRVGEQGVAVSVRLRGQPNRNPAMLFPRGTVPTVEHARECARTFKHFLAGRSE